MKETLKAKPYLFSEAVKEKLLAKKKLELKDSFNKEELDLFWKGLRIHGRSSLAIAKMIPT